MSMRKEDEAALEAAVAKIQEANAKKADDKKKQDEDRSAQLAAWRATMNGTIRPVLDHLVKKLRSLGVDAQLIYSEGNLANQQVPVASLVWGRQHQIANTVVRNEWRVSAANFSSANLIGASRIINDQGVATDGFAVPDDVSSDWVSEAATKLVMDNLPSTVSGKPIG